MPAINLTREEARERARLLAVESYTVEIDLTRGETTFGSTTEIAFDCTEPGASTFVDLVSPRVCEVVLNGQSLDPAEVFDGKAVRLDGLAERNRLRVVADGAYMRTGEGLHRFVDPVDGAVYLYTQFETADARRVYAGFDQPDLKGTFQFDVIAPADWEVVSNSETPEPEQVREGVSRWRFPTTPRMSTYVTALVAGPYHAVRDEHRGVPLGVFCRRSLAEHLDADAILEVTKQGFDFFERQFDYAYPFAKYDQLFVPEFNAGAMENAGCVTFLEDYVFRSKVTDATYERRAETILHELAHMWFGDLVTMRWWDDLWLNESFATYASVLAQSEVTRWTHAWTTFANVEKAWAYRQDQLPSTHPVVADIRDLHDVNVNFDGITYAKGASVLKQLVAWVGREQFLEGVRRYFVTHEWGNTTLRDLLECLEETSGRDLDAWSREWLETAGVATLTPRVALEQAGRYTSFEVVQSAPPEHPTLRSHRLSIGLYDRGPEGIVRRRRLELDIAGAATPVPDLVGEPQPDLLLLNDDDLTYAKIRLDERSLATVVRSIGEIRESLPRALCWSTAWDMTRDAQLRARDFLTLVLGGVAAEGDITVVQGLLRQVTSAIELFVAPDHRPQARTRLADRLAELTRSAEPGSDRQLAYVRAFAIAAVSDDHLHVVDGLLSGEESLDGLTVDTDLRWHLLHQLVAAGRADKSAVDAELERDPTASGRRAAAAALAARPTPAAKAEAWHSAVENDELPNQILSAVVSGFAHPRQRGLLEPYVEPYFASIADVWARRTQRMAQVVVVGLFPSLLVDEAVVARTDRWLAEADGVPALRRLVLEGRDGLARALRAQARDAAE